MCNFINANLHGKLSVGQGERGKSIEYMWRGTSLGIRQEGEEEYNFVNLAGGNGSGSGNGVDGREVELQVGSGYLQWRYKGEEEWKNLISIDSLKGEKGDKGEQGIQGIQGDKGERGETGLQGARGEQGPKGDTGERGSQGLPGKDGRDGTNGTNGQDGYTPVKGKDYYTNAEKEELITEILNRIPNGNEVAY